MKDIATRIKLGLNKECVMMCGGNISNLDQFTLNDAIKWYEKIIQHPCKWIIEYNGTYCSDIYMGIINSVSINNGL